MKRLLIYSHDTFGLGNMRRMTAIAEHLVNNDPELTILLVSGSNALPAFELPPRIDYIKLPCLARDVDGQYDAKSLSVDLQSIIQMRANVILSAMLDFSPDMILVDKKPFGVSNELQPVLEVIAQRVKAPKVVLLLRDILDDAASTRQIWRRNGYHEAIERFYDAVLVVGDPRVYDLGVECDFPAGTRNRMRYCGYIRKPGPTLAKQIDSQAMVLVTPGGGEDGHRLVQTYMDSLNEPTQQKFASMVFLGPELAETKARAIRCRARQLAHNGTALTVRRFTKRMGLYMQQADVLVTMGGYNTVYEGLSLNKSMIVVPRTEPSKEQEIRAECLTRLGHIRSIHPAELTPMRLAAAVDESFKHPTLGLDHIDFNGLINVRHQLTNIAEGSCG